MYYVTTTNLQPKLGLHVPLIIFFFFSILRIFSPKDRVK